MSTHIPDVTALVRRIDGGSSQSLVEQASDAILDAIARGVFLPGDRMVEAHIAADLGFSRVPVREALRGLDSRGFLQPGGRSLRLIEPTQRDVAELIELRRMLETAALRHALAQHRGVERWRPLHAALQEGKAAAATKDSTRVIAADRLFHELLWRQAGHSFLLSSLIELWHRQMIMWSVLRDRLPFEAAQSEHEAILTAIEAGDMKTAERCLMLHIGWLGLQDFRAALADARAGR